jgi:glycosyltransferase involved in cell wall biosynthesis
VFCSQNRAYQALGAEVFSLAVGIGFGQSSKKRSFWANYYRLTSDLAADARFHTGPSLWEGLRLLFDTVAATNYAQQIAANSHLSPIPPRLVTRPSIDLIHCNHFFNMPLASRLKSHVGAPIVLDTHDIQAHQFHLRRAKTRFNRRASTVEEMLNTELDYIRQADIIVHLNSYEYDFFSSKIPECPHVLLYPAILSQTDNRECAPFFLIVASANYPNYLSVAWFLDDVYPSIGNVNLRIVGNIDDEFRTRSPELYAKYKAHFCGRVADLNWLYDNAIAVLLPTIAGHGLSIKTIEAMATGAPLIATSLALRGIGKTIPNLANLRIADSPVEFARHVREMDAFSTQGTEALNLKRTSPERRGRATSDTRKLCEELFSLESYMRGISDIAARLLPPSKALLASASRSQHTSPDYAPAVNFE